MPAEAWRAAPLNYGREVYGAVLSYPLVPRIHIMHMHCIDNMHKRDIHTDTYSTNGYVVRRWSYAVGLFRNIMPVS